MRALPFAIILIVATTISATAQQPEIATSVAFTEGPTVDRDGTVYFTEMVSLRIMKLSAAGVLSTFREQSNDANGLLIDPQGRLIACEGAESNRTGVAVKFKPQVTRTDVRSGKIEVLADNYQGQPFVGPNDVTIVSTRRTIAMNPTYASRRICCRSSPLAARYRAARRSLI